MDTVTVIRGTFANDHFVPDEPPPPIHGRAELFVYAAPSGALDSAKTAENGTRTSIFDLLGKAAVLRSGEDIDAQLEAERNAWGED